VRTVVLVATVGGETAPQETAVSSLRPLHATFICSRESTDKTDALVSQVELLGGTAEKLLLDYVDDFEYCYAACLERLICLRNTYPDAEVRADYTGGTKTMCAALVVAAINALGVQLSLVTGARRGSERVMDGTQSLRTVQTGSVRVDRLKTTALEAFGRYDYAATMALLREALAQQGLHGRVAAYLQDWFAVAQALDCWDRFQHKDAWRLLLPYRDRLTDLFPFLKAVMWSRTQADASFTCEGLEGIGKTAKGHGYELVEDLLLNAERRAARGLYDDAVARLYRGTELLAQIRLKCEYELDTSNVDVTNPKLCPDDIEWLKRGALAGRARIDLGLVRSYELLARLNRHGTEPLGANYAEQYRGRIRDFLLLRNASLLAHGCTPLGLKDWESAHSFFNVFLQDVRGALALKPYAQPLQFPTDPSMLTR
jgi:CRISPR-associated protein (TIGR02710 family)